jgi:hypothetical protein
MQSNASRIKVLQAQDDLVNEMKEEAMKALLNVSKGHHHLLEFLPIGHHDNFYQRLLKELIVQVIIHACPSIHSFSYVGLVPKEFFILFSFVSKYY